MGPVERRTAVLPDVRVASGLAVLAVAAAAILLHATALSIGVTADGVIYFDAATRLVREGRLDAYHYGEIKPVTHYPPLLPAVLSLGLTAGQPILEFARWLNVVLLAVTVVAVGATVHVATRSVSAALLAGALAAFAADTIGVFAVLLSEGVFLPLQVATLLATSVYVWSGSKRALVLGALAAAVACLVRFPAVVLVATGVCAVLLLRRTEPLRQRMRVAALFASISAGPLALWLLVREFTVGTATNRDLAFHPVVGERLRQALATLNEWLLPQVSLSNREMLALAIVVTAAFVALCVMALRRRGPGAAVVAVHLTYALGYLAFLLFAVTLIDAQTPFDRRILLPLRIALIAPFAIGVHSVAVSAPRVGRVAVAIAGVWLVLTAHHMALAAARLHADGYGYTSLDWQSADVPRLVRNAGAPVIYSNAPEALYFLTGIHARELPAPIDRWTRRTNPDYPRQLATMRAALDAREAAVIYFRRATRAFVPSAQELAAALDLSRTEWGSSAILLRRTDALAGVMDADTILPAAELIRR